jgi:hypothetical protein
MDYDFLGENFAGKPNMLGVGGKILKKKDLNDAVLAGER